MMPFITSPRKMYSTALCMLSTALWLGVAGQAAAQQPATALSTESSTSPAPRTVAVSLPANVNPFTEIERQSSTGKTTAVSFARTPIDTKAEAKAEVIQSGQTLLVRMRAKDLPLPSHFEVPRYAVWVYIPNYQVKMYIGDLPVIPYSRSKKGGGPRRGDSDTAYRFTSLPPGAVFGGLAVTAEPIRFTPIVNDALRPVLVGLLPKEDAASMIAATTVYSGTIPAKGGEGSAPSP